MPIKVLVISNYRTYYVVRPEAEVFIGLAKLGFEITIMTYGDAAYCNAFREAGIDVIDFHPEKKLDRDEIGKIRSVLVEKKIDILHLFNGKAIVNGIKAAKGLPVKIALYRGYSGNVYWFDPTAYYKYLNPRVDKIWCLSRDVEEHFHRQLFFNKSKTTPIYKGHDLHWYQDVPERDLKKELGLSPEAFLLITVANNRKVKGVTYLLEAMNRLPSEKDIHLLLVGRDLDTPENLKIVKKGNRANKTHFIGYQEGALDYIKACDAYILPSYQEGMAKALIEAMCLDVPVIASSIPSTLEIVEDGKSALIFPVEDRESLSKAVLRLSTDPALRLNLAKEAKENVKKWLTLETTIHKVKQMYEELVKQ